MYYVGNIPFGYSDIRHYGVLGMKWGVRKQPESSSGGIRRFRTDQGSQSDIQKRERRRQRIKTGFKIGASIAAAGLIAYGAKRISDLKKENANLQLEAMNSKWLDTMRERVKKDGISGTRKAARIFETGDSLTKRQRARVNRIGDRVQKLEGLSTEYISSNPQKYARMAKQIQRLRKQQMNVGRWW